MADVMDTLADRLAALLGGGGKIRAIPSMAPGGGPSAAREGASDGPEARPALRPLGTPPSMPPSGGRVTGYGGHAQPILVEQGEDVERDLRAAIQRQLSTLRATRQRDAHPRSRIRLNIPFSLEARIRDHTDDVVGVWSLYDGTAAAPGAGNSTQQITVQVATNALPPVQKLDQYPAPMYLCLRVSSFAWVPTGSTMTGLQELWFIDQGGAVCPLGIYNAASQTAGAYVGVSKLMTSPYTDPGNVVLGTINVNNIGIGGTPVSVRWQLGITFEGMVPDPWFNERHLDMPTPADQTEALMAASLEASHASA